VADDIVLQCEACNKGIVATLLQDGKPLANKSRSLTDAETKYATIEKEMLVIVWGLNSSTRMEEVFWLRVITNLLRRLWRNH